MQPLLMWRLTLKLEICCVIPIPKQNYSIQAEQHQLQNYTYASYERTKECRIIIGSSLYPRQNGLCTRVK